MVDRIGIFLFLTLIRARLSLIEKGEKRYDQTAKGNQKTNDPNEYQNNIRSCHITHLPSYVIQQAGTLIREAAAPVMGTLFVVIHHVLIIPLLSININQFVAFFIQSYSPLK